MVSLLPEKPQLGRSYRGTAKVLEDFECEFTRWCDRDRPKRVTPEKMLQSFLIADALSNGRRMKAINEASERTTEPTQLVFITDEMVIPSIAGSQRLDLLCLSVGRGGGCSRADRTQVFARHEGAT